MKKSYVMKWILQGNSHFLVTGFEPIEDLWLL